MQRDRKLIQINTCLKLKWRSMLELLLLKDCGDTEGLVHTKASGTADADLCIHCSQAQ